jgi:hypothetical protein
MHFMTANNHQRGAAGRVACYDVGQTRQLVQFASGPVGRSLPRSPPQQGWHHHQRCSRPRARRGNRASAQDPMLTVRVARGT